MRRALFVPLAALLALQAPAWGGEEEAAFRLALAKLLSDDGALSEALESYAEAARLAPEDPYIRIEWADLLARLGRWSLAAEQAEKAVRLDPDEPHALRTFARVNLALAETVPGALEDAIEAYEKLRKSFPEDPGQMATLAQIYLRQGSPARAAEVMRELRIHQPRDRRALSLLVEALVQAGRSGEAEETLSAFLQADPQFTRARLMLADLQSDRADYQGALNTLERGSKSERGDPEYRRRLALELYRTGRSQQALDEVEAVLEVEPDHFGALYLKGLALIRLGRSGEAIPVLEGLFRSRPEHRDLGLLLAASLERGGRVDEAVETLERLGRALSRAGREEEAAGVGLEQASLLARLERWPEVVSLTSELLGENPGEARRSLEFLYANALAESGHAKKALDFLERLEGERPETREVISQQAEILIELGRLKAARKKLSALEGSGQLEDLLLAAEVYQRAGLYGEAVPILKKAVDGSGDSVQARFWLGAAYERSGQEKEAEETFRRLLEMDPDFAPALNYLGYMWAEKGVNLEEARTLVSRAVALDPDNGAYLDSLGWAHFRLGDHEEALIHLERAAELVVDDAVVFEHLGDVYAVLRRWRQAREVYERALELGSDNASQVQRKLRELPLDL